jgi:dolichol-phosphate mannosyltransferase
MTQFLTALPVFNEEKYVQEVLDQVLQHTDHVLVVDDGSTDNTTSILKQRVKARGDVTVIHHETNRGYGAALTTAFAYALHPREDGTCWKGLITIDCDGQHQPQLIPSFIAALENPENNPPDIVSGSRYLARLPNNDDAPEGRRHINMEITHEINQRLGLSLTDAFCGFKSYSRKALESLPVTETGYAMPLEVWVLAAAAKLNIVEVPVPLVYLDLTRSFGGALDDGTTRIAHYREILERTIRSIRARSGVDRGVGYGVGSPAMRVDA